MKLQLVEADDSIPAGEMKDGDLAVITEWDGLDYKGYFVQRYGNDLVSISKPKKSGWINFFCITSVSTSKTLRVRLLKPGDMIKVVKADVVV